MFVTDFYQKYARNMLWLSFLSSLANLVKQMLGFNERTIFGNSKSLGTTLNIVYLKLCFDKYQCMFSQIK